LGKSESSRKLHQILIESSDLQTIIHVGAIAISLLSFYTVAFIFNGYCTTCMANVPNTARTIHDATSTLIYYLILLLSPVMALLPRLFIRTLKNTLRPSDDIVAQVELRRERKRGENLLASWSSRSTSRSSIFR
jgi:hypothetical protein